MERGKKNRKGEGKQTPPCGAGGRGAGPEGRALRTPGVGAGVGGIFLSSIKFPKDDARGGAEMSTEGGPEGAAKGGMNPGGGVERLLPRSEPKRPRSEPKWGGVAGGESNCDPFDCPKAGGVPTDDAGDEDDEEGGESLKLKSL